MPYKFFLAFSLIFIGHFSNAQTVTDAPASPPDTLNKIFLKLDIKGEFPRDSVAWEAFLRKNIKADIPGKNGAPNGTYEVIIRFIIAKDGTISDVVPETKFGFGMEEEALKAIKKGPKWLPATQDERKVGAYCRQHVTFVLSDK